MRQSVQIKRARFVVRGFVQGVNFRANAVREANARRLTGRVWNRNDGAVELIVEGGERGLDEFTRWLERGPRMADVDSVERTDLVGERRYRDFDVSYGPAT